MSIDLGGNVRKNPKLSGTTHNVFGIQVGVSINFFVRRSGKAFQTTRLSFSTRASTNTGARKRKCRFLEAKEQYDNVSNGSR